MTVDIIISAVLLIIIVALIKIYQLKKERKENNTKTGYTNEEANENNDNNDNKIKITFKDILNSKEYQISFKSNLTVKQMICTYLTKINSSKRLNNNLSFIYNGLNLNSLSFGLKSINEIFEFSNPIIIIMTRKIEKVNDESKIKEKSNKKELIYIKFDWKNNIYTFSYSTEITVAKMLLDIASKINLNKIFDTNNYSIMYKTYILNNKNHLKKSLKAIFGGNRDIHIKIIESDLIVG